MKQTPPNLKYHDGVHEQNLPPPERGVAMRLFPHGTRAEEVPENAKENWPRKCAAPPPTKQGFEAKRGYALRKQYSTNPFLRKK